MSKWFGLLLIWLPWQSVTASVWDPHANVTEAERVGLKRQLPAGREAGTLMSILERLAELGEFRQPIPAAERELWRAVYRSPNGSIAVRRYLVELLGEYNFSEDEPLFSMAAADPMLATAAGELWMEHAPDEFARRMTRWAESDTDWTAALRHSRHLARNEQYRRALLKRFQEKKQPELLLFFVPLLCEEQQPRGAEVIRRLLTETEPREFRLNLALAESVLDSSPWDYTAELRTMRKKHAGVDHFERSRLFALLLAARCRANDPEALSAAILLFRRGGGERETELLSIFQRIHPRCSEAPAMAAALTKQWNKTKK